MYMYDLPQLWPIFATLPDNCKKKNASFLSNMQYRPNIRGIIIIVNIMIRKNIYGGVKCLQGEKGEFFEHPPFLMPLLRHGSWNAFRARPQDLGGHICRRRQGFLRTARSCGANIGDVCWA